MSVRPLLLFPGARAGRGAHSWGYLCPSPERGMGSQPSQGCWAPSCCPMQPFDWGHITGRGQLLAEERGAGAWPHGEPLPKTLCCASAAWHLLTASLCVAEAQGIPVHKQLSTLLALSSSSLEVTDTPNNAVYVLENVSLPFFLPYITFHWERFWEAAVECKCLSSQFLSQVSFLSVGFLSCKGG